MHKQLVVYINDVQQEIQVPDTLIIEADSFFDKMDADMNKGYQMSRTWVSKPDLYQRCQIVSDRILSALSNGKEDVYLLMTAYIFSKMPTIQAIYFNIEGDMTQHELIIK